MTKNMRFLAIGGVGLAIGTTLSLVFPDADGIAGTAIMLILCLSTAMCGAAVPGVLKFDSKAVRASGAAAFFVLPWLIPYGSGDAEADEPPPPDHAQPADAGASSPLPTSTTGGGTRPPAPTDRPPAARPGTTFRPPALPASRQPVKPPAKPRISRPRTIFDGLFSSKPSQK